MQIHVTRSGIGGVYGHPVTRCDAGGCAAGTELYYADLVPSQVMAGDIVERMDDDPTDAAIGPTPCVNCGSPACEWPGECKPVGQLPVVVIAGERYFRDDRLEEFRNVKDPHDRISFEFFDGSEEGLPGDPPSCAACGAELQAKELPDAVEMTCPVCTAPLEAPEEILDILNDLIEWNAFVGPFENEVWDRARAIRDRLVVK